MHSIDTEDHGNQRQNTGRWGKHHNDERNWQQYNEELVIRGKMIFDLDFRDKWESELKTMNMGKRGSPYLFPESFMNLMMIWHQYLDYRGLEGIARSLVDPGIITYYGDNTTVWNRIHDMTCSEHIRLGICRDRHRWNRAQDKQCRILQDNEIWRS